MSFYHTKQKFDEAIFAMAVNPDSLQKRVINTYRLYLSQLTKDELPEEVKSDYENIKRIFTNLDSEKDANEYFEELATTMLNEQAKMIADKTLEMRHIIKRY